MNISKQTFSQYVKELRFRELFNEIGWNNDRTVQPVVIENTPYNLQAVAVKCGLKILTCRTHSLPDTALRKKLDTQIKKLFYHYLLICIDEAGAQRWIIPVKKTEGRELVFIDYTERQAPELLFQKVSQLTFSLDQEERLTIVDVSKRVNDVFVVNSEKITKQFYDRFKKEHTSFLKFIKGIKEITDQQWYASLMLNRLMFCYFIQKQGFLDGNKNYLRDKLQASIQKKGKDKFYSFYRSFLLVLFHKGLNDPSQSEKIKKEIGRVPYLNGGLFDVHELERENKQIEIADKAFESLFDFFDQYEWHLDTRQTSTGKDINPDVIGYIFEKYINDRAEMGAYYTKEDITDYISKNCIIPFLFDETKRHYAKAFLPEAELWQRVKNSGTDYIYDAVKKGVELPLPEEIEIGVDTKKPNLIERRKEWNKLAPEEYALPTEIWREVVERRNRFAEIKTKIESGEIQQINDFITYNLNIRQFAQDVIENTNDPEFLKHFYKVLSSVTILDPTCGSGAFLFAAMNILEPLYEACLLRMENFIADSKKGRHKFFEDILAEVQSPHHPNREYYIYKSIILRNLYGVDIMKEAVEIAKLRLFLKLMATIEVDYRKKNLGIEPLPDIDFNIRAGNTLVGYTKESDVDRAFEEKLDLYNNKEKVKEKCEQAAGAFGHYKDIQLSHGDDYAIFKFAKDELNNRLRELNLELNKLIHEQSSGAKFDSWLKSHRPFHWFAEFYEIIHAKGGFDVIIGNPPYVEYPNKKIDYKLLNYELMSCGNLYAYIIEKCYGMLSPKGRWSMIIPTSSFSTDRMIELRKKIVAKNNCWVSFFGNRPATLFTGAQQNLCLPICARSESESTFTTQHKRWYNEEREIVFNTINYTKNQTSQDLLFYKFGYDLETEILNKIRRFSIASNYFIKNSSNYVYFSNAAGYWIHALTKLKNPKFSRDKKIALTTRESQTLFCSLLNSDIFFWYWQSLGDCYHITSKETNTIGLPAAEENSQIYDALNKLEADMIKNIIIKTTNEKTGKSVQEEFYPKKSRNLIVPLTKLLGNLYGFTPQESDFISNYDIKYRMGKELEGEEE